MSYLKTLLLGIIIASLLLPVFNCQAKSNDTVFKAEVVSVIKQITNSLPDGTITEQQDLELLGLEGDFEGQTVIFNGIGNYDSIKKDLFKKGDRVMVAATSDAEGNYLFFVTDYVRSNTLYWLVGLFIVTLFLVGGFKGFRSLLSLSITFLVILKYIIPRILAGDSPILVTVIGSILILLSIIYITEGFKRKSHIAVVSIFISLLITIIISWIAIELARLTGVFSEEVAFLVNIGDNVINFKGLLLAGIIIGTLGVLDDVVISQVVAVEEISKLDNNLSRLEIFKKAYNIGTSHISSMTNTLFLAYAGASMSILILFASGESSMTSWSHVINNEAIATEIVRTLSGSIGLVLSVPIATGLAVYWFKK